MECFCRGFLSDSGFVLSVEDFGVQPLDSVKQSNSFGFLVSGVSRNTQSVRERCVDNGCVMGSRGFGG